MFVQFISPGQFVAPFSLRLYVQDVGRADAFDKCALPKTNGYDNSTVTLILILSCVASINETDTVSYTHLTLPTIYSV